ncbi:S1C family serine protease [Parafilimonas sp.]|uniref:S1C family serine protease n=1 Tax=Parafilimonas sp. TaxID=1969739 RepID=UPI0039E4B2A5
MKTLFFFLQFTLFSFLSQAQLNTKLIASRYGSSIVKIICSDTSQSNGENKMGQFLLRGSGFFVSSDGYIFTNRHVIETCVWGYIDYDYLDDYGKVQRNIKTYSEAAVYDKSFVKAERTGYTIPIVQVFYGTGEDDYKLYIAEVVAVGTGAFDGAILKVVSDIDGHKITLNNFSAVPLGNSDSVQQGERFCVAGYPAQTIYDETTLLHDMSTLSTGIMSGYEFNMNKDYGYIKTDAAIHGGNSGGPVFDENNKVIGIATASGIATGIGLVGGINGMYYVSASNAIIHSQLIAKGLKAPIRAMSINTALGERQPIRTANEINGIQSSATSQNFANASVYFSNVPPDNSGAPPGQSQQYSSFSLDSKKGGTVYVYIDNYPALLNTDAIVVLIDKLNKSGQYEKFQDKKFEINGALDFTYFQFTLKERGTFRFTVYSKDIAYISSGTVEFVKK